MKRAPKVISLTYTGVIRLFLKRSTFPEVCDKWRAALKLVFRRRVTIKSADDLYRVLYDLVLALQKIRRGGDGINRWEVVFWVSTVLGEHGGGWDQRAEQDPEALREYAKLAFKGFKP